MFDDPTGMSSECTESTVLFQRLISCVGAIYPQPAISSVLQLRKCSSELRLISSCSSHHIYCLRNHSVISVGAFVKCLD
jgi:hypothetical protein